jgi:hypothetical protein
MADESAAGPEQQFQQDDATQQIDAQSELVDATASTAATEQAGNGQVPRFIRQTFTSSAAGVRAGEDKRFNAPQAFVDFDDDKRATADEKAELNQAGFRYRPSDKGYSALATADTRQARDDLAQKFTERRLKEKTGEREGNER